MGDMEKEGPPLASFFPQLRDTSRMGVDKATSSTAEPGSMKRVKYFHSAQKERERQRGGWNEEKERRKKQEFPEAQF